MQRWGLRKEPHLAPEDRYDSLFAFYGAKYGVPPSLLKAQVRAESAFNPRAHSPVGALGLAQFMPGTFAAFGQGSPMNPEEAIAAQANYMAKLIRDFGQVRLALAAYNFGPRRVKQGNEWPTETTKYVDKILAEYLPTLPKGNLDA